MSTSSSSVGTAGKSGQTREHVLHEASTLMREKGYRSTSIGDVLERSGIQKGSFYYYFPSKEDLGHAVLDLWDREVRETLLEPLANGDGPPPLDRIDRTLERFVEEMRSRDCRIGCKYGNLAQELADVNEGFRVRLSETFRAVAAAFGSLIERAKADGTLDLEIDSAAAGEAIVATIEGGLLLAKVHRSCAPMASTIGVIRSHLAAHRRT